MSSRRFSKKLSARKNAPMTSRQSPMQLTSPLVKSLPLWSSRAYAASIDDLCRRLRRLPYDRAMPKVFVSWSGPRSKIVADALRENLPTAIQSVKEVFVSSEMTKGVRWADGIAKELATTE